MTRRSMLDVNVLIALFDAEHVHHDVAHDWFSDHRADGWATCPLTENGFVRLMSHPSRRRDFTPISDVMALFRTFRASGHHEFWPDTISFCDDQLFDVLAVRSQRHLTDVYLLGLAVRHRGRLVTFDQKIPVAVVRGARKEDLVVLASAA